MYGGIMFLPFKQDPSTVRVFKLPGILIYINRAKPCSERHSDLLHGGNHSFWPIMHFCYGLSKEGRAWVSHKTRPNGSYIEVRNAAGKTSFIHRITTAIRESGGTNYRQVIFFSWWVGIVRAADGGFQLQKGD